MVSWWGRDSYFNDEHIQISVIEIQMLHLVHQDVLDHELGQIFNYHCNFTGRRIRHPSKSTPINGPVHKQKSIFHTLEET